MAGERRQLLKDFRQASEERRGDRDYVLSVVRKCGIALEFAAGSLQADPEVVSIATKQDGFALEYAADELKANFNIVRAAVQQDGWALEFAASALQDNSDIVLEAIGSSWKVLQFASERVRGDAEIMAKALEQSPDARKYEVKNKAGARPQAGLPAKTSDIPLLDECAVVKEPPPEYKGGLLQKMPRSRQLPRLENLPDRLQNCWKDKDVRRIRIRLIVFYGAGDSFAQWAQFMVDAPEWVEVVVHEWPSHGIRTDEAHPKNLDELADDAMDALRPIFMQHAAGGKHAGAPLAFMGHSIGSRLMTFVASRLRANMYVEPQAVFVLDSGPPNVKLMSDAGESLLLTEPERWLALNNQMVFNSSKGPDGMRVIDMWQRDLLLGQDIRPVGFHCFHCNVVVFVAMHNFSMDDPSWLEQASPEQLAYRAKRVECSGSRADSAADFDREDFDKWGDWTSAGLEAVEVATDHMGVKMFPQVLSLIYERLKLVRINSGISTGELSK